MPEARRSVRRQLLVLLLGAVSAAWAVAAAISFADARHEVSEVLDAHLAQVASVVSVQPNRREDHDHHDDHDEADTEHAPVLHRYGRRVMFQVWQDGTRLGLHSSHAPDTPLSPVREGFSDIAFRGARWRVFSTWDARRRVLVQVAEQHRDRDELATAVARNFILPLAIALPVLGLVIWAAVGRATRSLTDVNQQVGARAADNFTPIDVAGAPSEIDALVTNLNGLFRRVESLVEQERQFTADAAHELRTPIAAIRAQAQVALAAGANAERDRALQGVIAGCDRATHVVEQILTLARLAPDAVSLHLGPVAIGPVLQTVMGELAPAALAQRIDLSLVQDGAVRVAGDPALLAVLFRNVVDNAIRYSPAGTRVDVESRVIGATAQIAVTDSGPGIAVEERAKIGRRFYRPPGAHAPGSGLGLAIVQRILDLLGGTMQMATPDAGIGLRVTIVLPRVEQGPP
jgi:two-component system sensor histidine kinase QseC